MIRRCWAFIACAIAPIAALAADTQQVTVRFTIDPVSGSVLQTRAIHVYLRTNVPDIVVTKVMLEPSEELLAVRPDLKAEPPNFTDVTNPAEHDELHPDIKGETELIFRWPNRPFWSPLQDWDLIFFEPGKQTLTLRHEEKPPVAGEPHQFSDPVEATFTAPRLAVTLGGAAGALALAVLRLIYRLRGADKSIAWLREAREALLAVFAGALIAGILTFLGDLLIEARLGVQLAATSWKGGFIIGLFSYKLGDVFAQKFWDEPQAR
jgi:hypothetical protein